MLEGGGVSDTLNPLPDMHQKNITRYTYENTDFQGWRVSIQRCGRIITRYFSDLQYGSEEESYRHAVDYRDEVFTQMARHKADLPDYMDHELEHLQELLRQKESEHHSPAMLGQPLRTRKH